MSDLERRIDEILRLHNQHLIDVVAGHDTTLPPQTLQSLIDLVEEERNKASELTLQGIRIFQNEIAKAGQ